MTRLRNVLIGYGAVVGAAQMVRLVVNGWFRSEAWGGAGSDTVAITWFLGSAAAAAAIAGFIAGVAIDSRRSGAWAILVGCMASLEDSPLLTRSGFSSFGAFARLTWACWLLAGVVAGGCFVLARIWRTKPVEHAA